jgi:hypothetical protein
MRAVVHFLLKQDHILDSLGVQKVYGSNAVDTPKEQIFLITRWEETNVAFSNVATRNLAVIANCRSADYKLLDNILDRVKELMTETVHLSGSDGELTQARWTGDSTDGRDPGFRTYIKSSSFQCNGVI